MQRKSFEKQNIEQTDIQRESCEYTEQEFLTALKKTSHEYLLVVIVSAVFVMIGIWIAVSVKVSYGLVCAMAAVVFYIFAVGNILYKRLGIAYASTTGQLRITKYHGRGKADAWIPRRLLWLDVTEIDDGAFDQDSSHEITTVHLPQTLRRIGKDVFRGCEKLECICFEGNREEWESIESETDLSTYSVELDVKVAYSRDRTNKQKGADVSQKEQNDGGGAGEKTE